MEPILLIHGYSSEGKDNSAADIYGSLPDELRRIFRDTPIEEIDLSRWISLSDGISLDDVCYAMQRALEQEQYKHLLQSGFHVIIHSTGALVVRNWIRRYREKTGKKRSPIRNLIHLAGANFGSGLAHIGQGQLSRWGRTIFQNVNAGVRVLRELEFGSWKTIDMHLGFIESGGDMYMDYQVQEFCIIGSQTLTPLRAVPIRYVKEDSADNTVRTSSGNLNFNYAKVEPTDDAKQIKVADLSKLVEQRLDNEAVTVKYYTHKPVRLADQSRRIPFAVLYETAHFSGPGQDIGIVSGRENRDDLMPLIKAALETPYDEDAYASTAALFTSATRRTFKRAESLNRWFEWNEQGQYEGHAQLIFRLRDQFGQGVEHFDITFKSHIPENAVVSDKERLETMIEDRHINKANPGTITFYIRTQKYDKNASPPWRERLKNIFALDIEITGTEPASTEIQYFPVTFRLNASQIRAVIQSFRTTIIDVTLLRLPAAKVFSITQVD